MSIKIQFGAGNSIEKPQDSFPTVGQVLADGRIQDVLGFDPARVEATINGVTVSEGTPIPDGATVVLQTKANTKG